MQGGVRVVLRRARPPRGAPDLNVGGAGVLPRMDKMVAPPQTRIFLSPTLRSGGAGGRVLSFFPQMFPGLPLQGWFRWCIILSINRMSLSSLVVLFLEMNAPPRPRGGRLAAALAI